MSHALQIDPNESLPQDIINLYASINEATYRLLKLIAEFDEAGLGFKLGFLTTAHWLSYTLGLGGNAAREKVRVAKALNELPLIDAAFSVGKLSYSKVRALTRIADADNEATLVNMARNASAQQLEHIVRDQVRIKEGRPEVSSQPKFSLIPADNGDWHIKGRLPKELGDLLNQALNRLVDQDAITESDPAPISERRAYALMEIAEASLDGSSDQSQARSSAERYLVQIDADDPALSESAQARLLCDASLVHFEPSDALNIGRHTRTIPPAIRRALTKRDRGCRFPGCTHTRFTDAHHIQHWSKGGETKLDNLVLLCRRHHTLVHDGVVSIEVMRPQVGAVRFLFIDRYDNELRATGDRCLADPIKLPSCDVSAETSVVDNSVSPWMASPWMPDHPTRRPDFGHIAWILAPDYPVNPPECVLKADQ